MLRKVSRALGFLFIPRAHREPLAAGRSVLSTLAQAWRLFQDARAARAAPRTSGPELFASSIAWHGTTPQIVRSRVRAFQLMAALAAAFGGYGLYGALTGSPIIGFGCAAFASIYYMYPALWLYQIRVQSLCSLAEYLSVAWTNPAELLPRGLPPGWRLESCNLPSVRS